MQTKAGGLKNKQTMISRFGSEESWKSEMRRIGAIGGRAKVKKGFAVSGKASEAGRIGGSRSSRKGITNKSSGRTTWVKEFDGKEFAALMNLPQHPINNSIWSKVYNLIKRNKK